MQFTKEAMMDIEAGVEVSMTLVVAGGTAKELAPFARDPLPCHQTQPHPAGSTHDENGSRRESGNCPIPCSLVTVHDRSLT
jgi:hypothetical protein